MVNHTLRREPLSVTAIGLLGLLAGFELAGPLGGSVQHFFGRHSASGRSAQRDDGTSDYRDYDEHNDYRRGHGLATASAGRR